MGCYIGKRSAQKSGRTWRNNGLAEHETVIQPEHTSLAVVLFLQALPLGTLSTSAQATCSQPAMLRHHCKRCTHKKKQHIRDPLCSDSIEKVVDVGRNTIFVLHEDRKSLETFHMSEVSNISVIRDAGESLETLYTSERNINFVIRDARKSLTTLYTSEK